MGEQVDAESVRDLMFRYFHEMRSAIERHGGTVEKFIGDAVMAVFGVPVAHEDDALRAVRAAAEMRDRLTTLNIELERRFGTRITLRIGIDSGEVVAGDSTSRETIVTGKTVNIAARLEQAAEGGQILLGERTYRLVRAVVGAEPVAPLNLRGKAESVPAYSFLELTEAARAYGYRLRGEIVGREAELELLKGAVEQVVEERCCRLFVVIGQAGVGKSRLAEEFLDSLGPEAAVLSGGCLSYGEGITYWPLAEAVRQAATIRDEDSEDSAKTKLAALVVDEESGALIAQRISQAIGLSRGVAPPEEIAWAAGRLFQAIARRRPLVLLLEDLHWAEPTFLDLIDYLAAALHDAPILLLALARPEFLERGADFAGVIRLEPLDQNDSALLIESLLGRAGLSNNARLAIVEAAGGNPLFMEELLAMLIDDGLLRRENGHWVTPRELPAIAIPLTVEALLGARLDRLESGERATVERGAVEGQVFHRGGVVALSDEELRSHVPAFLEALTRREFVRPAPATFADDAAFRFRHILIREAAYAGTAKKLRAELHARFADWLEQMVGARTGEYLEILGHHLERAYRYREELGPVDETGRALGIRAAERLASAGQRALGRGDMPAATNLLGRAASLFPTREPRRLQILPDLGDSLMQSGDLVRADEVLTEAINAPLFRHEQQLRARALVERTLLRSLTDPKGQAGEIQRVAGFAIPVLEQVSDHRSLAKAWKLLATRHTLELRFEELLAGMQRALEHARRADDARAQADILFWIGVAIWSGPTPVEEGLARIEEIFAPAKGPLAAGARLTMLAGLNGMRGHFDEARRLGEQARAIYEELGMQLSVAGLANVWGPIELLANDPIAAERELRQGYEGLKRIGEKSFLSTVAGYLARAVYEQGRYEDAAEWAVLSAETAAPDDLLSQILWRGTQAKVLARRGEFDEAEALARDATRLAERTDATETHADVLLDLAEVLRLAAQREEGVPFVQTALCLYEQKGVLPSIDKARALLAGEFSA